MVNLIKEIIAGPAFQEDITAFLTEICSMDTTPRTDVISLAQDERKVFDIITKRLLNFAFKNSEVVEKNISPAIEKHASFSALHYTKTESNPDGLSAAEAYRERYNLLYYINGEDSGIGHSTAVNAHIDVVAPFFAPEIKIDAIYGRGTIDDKGSIAAIYGALKVLDTLNKHGKVILKKMITAMFVIDEESGGNGSLSLAIDRELKKRYDSLLVMECAGNKVYPANRGAVWFWAQVNHNNDNIHSIPSASPVESIAFSILEMQKEGNLIREESDHPLFPHKPVQTCNGILGPFGEHPSRVCGFVSFVIKNIENTAQADEIKNCIQKGLDLYTVKFGDKTRVIDPNTGKSKVEKHVDIRFEPDTKKVFINVYGSPGHMASLHEHDAAITKWAYITREIVYYKVKKHSDIVIELENADSQDSVILEGGQGFLPVHSITEIRERIRKAFIKGSGNYLSLSGADEKSLSCKVTFEKLHNNACCSYSESESFKNAWEAALQSGIIEKNETVRGWDASCDARLFADEYPEMPVITSGPGELRLAHSDLEHIKLPDLYKSILFTVLFLLKETGSTFT
jgi:acetylornithine deacetylase/succinyl-diaminopimelate desuccinylase-like protein